MTALRNRKRRFRLIEEASPPPVKEPNAWAHLIKPMHRSCKRPGCPKTFRIVGRKEFCSDSCKQRHHYNATKAPTKIKQCAVPGCGNTFPDRMGGPKYCADCRELVRKAQAQASADRNREGNRPIRAAQQAARRAKWSPEKLRLENDKALARYYANKQPPKEETCDCGKVFIREAGGRIYCSPDCPVKLEPEKAAKPASFKKWYDGKKSRQPEQTCEWLGCKNTFRDKRATVCPEHREVFRKEQEKIRSKEKRAANRELSVCEYCKNKFAYNKPGPPPLACPRHKCQEAHKKHKNALALVRQNRYAAKQRGEIRA